MEKPNHSEATMEDDPSLQAEPPETSAAGEEDASIEELIARAKRTHELVDAVDLKKVAEHDLTEVAKVASVQEALGQIADGRSVEHVAGVDEVLPVIDAVDAALAELIETVDEIGWGDRIGRIAHVQDGQLDLKPLELIRHRQGLPEFVVCVAPNDATGIGYYGLFITASGVFAAAISEPPDRHHWRIVHSVPYEGARELKQCLTKLGQTAFE